MAEDNAAQPGLEPITPDQEAVWREVSLRKLKSLGEIAEKRGWVTSTTAKAIYGVLAALMLGAGASVVARFSTAPEPAPIPSPADDTGKIIVAELRKGFAEIKSMLDTKPIPPEPEPWPPGPPGPDDWGEGALPVEVKALAGRMVVIVAKTKGEAKWLIPPDSPCDLFEAGKKLSLTPLPTATDFAVGVVSIPDGAVAWTRIKVAGPKPPVPTPPNPKPPGPVPPAPNILTAKLQAAFLADAAPATTKDGQRKLLIGLYEAMGDHTKKQAIVTTTDLLADLKAVSAQFVPAAALIEARKIISAEIVAAIGATPGAKLDPELRPKAVDVFARIAKALGSVK